MKKSTLDWIKFGGQAVVCLGTSYLIDCAVCMLPIPAAGQVGKLVDLGLKKIGAWGTSVAVTKMAEETINTTVDTIFKPVVEDDDEPAYEVE